MLLDLSAVFDTIDHRILHSRLRRRFGVQRTASKWMTSYLDGRTQCSIIGQASSSSKPLNTGVPQGSVLGPILFSLYEQPTGEIIRKHGLAFHHYADDLQILITFDLNIHSILDAIRRLEECIAEIKTWMTAKYLKVNDDKTEFMPVVPRSAAHLLEGLTKSIGEVRVSVVKNVRNLGVYLDCHLDMSHNVAILLKSCYFHMYHIGQIRKFLPRKTIERVVNAMITSRIGDATFVSAAANLWNTLPLNLRLIDDICSLRLL